MQKTALYKWIQQFGDGRESLEDNHRSGNSNHAGKYRFRRENCWRQLAHIHSWGDLYHWNRSRLRPKLTSYQQLADEEADRSLGDPPSNSCPKEQTLGGISWTIALERRGRWVFLGSPNNRGWNVVTSLPAWNAIAFWDCKGVILIYYMYLEKIWLCRDLLRATIFGQLWRIDDAVKSLRPLFYSMTTHVPYCDAHRCFCTGIGMEINSTSTLPDFVWATITFFSELNKW